MRISVIIPTLFERPWLEETIESVRLQTRKPDEIIIVNGGTTFVNQNRGLAMATGDAFITLADDDLLDPTFLEKTEEMMLKGYDIVGTALKTFGLKEEVHQYENVPFGMSLIKKSLWFELGGFRTDISNIADYDFYERAIAQGARIAKIPEPLYLFRVHEGQLSY